MAGEARPRLGEQLRREISLKLRHSVRDPGLGPVSVTGVEVTAGLWLARVYVEPHGSEAQQSETMAALGRVAPFLRSTLGRELHIRRMPELRFHRDWSIEAGRRIEEILDAVLPPEASGSGAPPHPPGAPPDPPGSPAHPGPGTPAHPRPGTPPAPRGDS